MKTGIEGRLAVVTGAANGIGEAICHALAVEGVRVVLLDRDAPRLEIVSAAIGGRAAASHALDLTDRVAVRGVFADIAAGLGPVDILVNNVGQAPRERAQEFSEADPALWDFIIDVSLKTTLFCSQQVVPAMRERRWGKIVNISSEAPFTGGVRSPEYTAAKSGVIGFTRSLARQLAPFSVNVNSVGPGPTMTAAMESFQPAQLDRIKAAVPMGRLAAPAEIADAVCFLASERASYITGQTLLVNGGGVFH
ncbi:MAG: SDR family oxidoreductase [Rhizobiaceae bacterium]|nr:SDR family oxidoreductase [Rhizobiaceae bacterium]